MVITRRLNYKLIIFVFVVGLAAFFVSGLLIPGHAQVLPDLRILSITPPAEGTTFTNYPFNGENVVIEIQNIGVDYDGEYNVRIILRDFNTNGTICSSVVTGEVPDSEAIHELEFSFNDFLHCPDLGTQLHYIDVLVDADNVIPELQEANNSDISNSFSILSASAAEAPKLSDIETIFQSPTKMQIRFKLEGTGSPVVYHETDAEYIEHEIYSTSQVASSLGSGWYAADLEVLANSTNHFRVTVDNTNVTTDDMKFDITGLVSKAFGDGEYQLELGETVKLDNNNYLAYDSLNKSQIPFTVKFRLYDNDQSIIETTDSLPKANTYYEYFDDVNTTTVLALIKVLEIAPISGNNYVRVDLQSEGASVSYSQLQDSYWNFDEGEGQVIIDSGTGALNGSLGSTTTIETIDPTWRTGSDCISGSCLLFDGNDDYISLGLDNYIHDNASSFTISLWAKGFGYEDGINHGRGAWFGWTGSIPDRGVLFGPNDQNDIHFSVPINTNSAATVVINDLQSKDRWEHWAGVYDAPSRLLIVYKNGYEVSRNSSAHGVPGEIYIDDKNTVKIGDRGDGRVNFNGFIDEVRYRNAVKRPDEIKAEYDQHAPELPSPDLFHLRFNNDLKDENNRQPQATNQVAGISYVPGLLGNGVTFTSFGAYAQYQCNGIINDSASSLQTVVRVDEISNNDQVIWQTDNSLFALYYDYSSLNPAGERLLKARAGGEGSEILYIIQELNKESFWSLRSWHLATLTWEVSVADGVVPTGIMKYYVDGEFVGEQSFSGYVGCNSFRLGNNYGPTKNWDQGVIDEFKIFNRVLTAEEVKQNYDSYSMNALTNYVVDVSQSGSDSDIDRLIDKARMLREDKLDEVLAELKQSRDIAREQSDRTQYLASLLTDSNIPESAIEDLNQFITYGIDENTQKLGAGERAAVIHSFKAAFGKLPETEDELIDAFKIANGRWPSLRNSAAEERAKAQFKRIYLRDANMFNPNDNAAITVMAYGLRQKAENRNLDSEKTGINTFEYIYGKVPTATEEWNIMQAITYSGATREVNDADNDGLSETLEAQYGTDPNNSDTDGDGFLDGQEVVSGFSPK